MKYQSMIWMSCGSGMLGRDLNASRAWRVMQLAQKN